MEDRSGKEKPLWAVIAQRAEAGRKEIEVLQRWEGGALPEWVEAAGGGARVLRGEE